MFFSILLIQCFSAFPINSSCTKDDYLFKCGDLLICDSNNTCQFCNSDDQCMLSSGHNNSFCRYSSQYDENICIYKPLKQKINPYNILGAIFIFLLGIVIPFSGIDGGFIFTPLIINCFQISLKYLSSISSSLIFGNSLVSFCANLFRKHTFYQRPLINYNIVAIFEPLSWVGSVFGIMLCTILPNWVILIIDLILLLFAAIFYFIIGIKRNMKKYRSQYLFSETELATFPSSYIGPAYSRFLVLILFHLWIVFMLFPFLRGGDHFRSIAYLSPCSLSYWLVTLLPLIIYFIFEFFSIQTVRSYPVIGQPDKVKSIDYVLIVVLSLLSGLFTGLLGYSGEFIKDPLLSLLYLETYESQATSQMMMFFSTSVTSIQFIANGILNYQDFFILAGFQIIPSIIGNLLNRKFTNRFDVKGRFLIVVAVICLLGFGGTVYMCYEDLKQAIKNNRYTKLYNFCLLSD